MIVLRGDTEFGIMLWRSERQGAIDCLVLSQTDGLLVSHALR